MNVCVCGGGGGGGGGAWGRGAGDGAGKEDIIQPRKLWGDFIKPNLRFSIFSVCFVS